MRCPVSASDASHKKARAHRKSRMDTRTRERLPVLPTLVAWVAAERARTAELLAAAEQTRPGEVFTAAGTTLRRAVLKTQTTGRVWAEHPDTGSPRPQLRRTPRVLGLGRGRGIAPHRHPHRGTDRTVTPQPHPIPAADHRGAVPLLQIIPSKTDAERLLVISPELADVLSTIVARIRGTATSRWWCPTTKMNASTTRPCRCCSNGGADSTTAPVSETVLRDYLDHALTEIGVKDAAGQPMRYTFHDFRRLFITDAIAHGMPPHIAQLVAGHRDINTTMGYKAVYPEEVINGHRAFIARRRALRSCEEYRTPTDAEWAEFVGHFQRRKVAIGDCGRSYDTACIHEHSCLRCPLLRPDPAARARLEEIRDNLLARIGKPNPTAGTARPRASRSASPAPTPNSPRWTRSAPAAPRQCNWASPASPTPPDALPTLQTTENSSETTENELNDQDQFSSDLIPPSRRDVSGHTSPTVDQAEPGRPLGRSRSEITSPALSNQDAGLDETDCGPRKVAGRSVGDPKEPLPTLRPATSRHNENLV